MKCKICGATCVVSNKILFSHYCETYPDKNGGHYSIQTLIHSSKRIENYKYNDFLIQKCYDYDTENCKDILIYLENKSNKQYTRLNISTDVFNRMNFDPKNPRSVLDKLELLKCFY